MGKVVNRLKHFPQELTALASYRATRKVAIYARVSTDSDEQLNSIEAQKDYYKKYVETRPNWEFCGLYADEGTTGTSQKHRVEFCRMLEDGFSGKFDLIITKSISRFARNTVDSLVCIRKLKEKGCDVYFEKEDLLTFDAKGEFMLTLLSCMAQEEARSISENVTWGLRKRFKEGKNPYLTVVFSDTIKALLSTSVKPLLCV